MDHSSWEWLVFSILSVNKGNPPEIFVIFSNILFQFSRNVFDLLYLVDQRNLSNMSIFEPTRSGLRRICQK